MGKKNRLTYDSIKHWDKNTCATKSVGVLTRAFMVARFAANAARRDCVMHKCRVETYASTVAELVRQRRRRQAKPNDANVQDGSQDQPWFYAFRDMKVENDGDDVDGKNKADTANDNSDDDDDVPLVASSSSSSSSSSSAESKQKRQQPADNGTGCSICCLPYDQQSRRRMAMNCGHVFCRNCLVRMVQAKPAADNHACPMCNQTIQFVVQIFGDDGNE